MPLCFMGLMYPLIPKSYRWKWPTLTLKHPEVCTIRNLEFIFYSHPFISRRKSSNDWIHCSAVSANPPLMTRGTTMQKNFKKYACIFKRFIGNMFLKTSVWLGLSHGILKSYFGKNSLKCSLSQNNLKVSFILIYTLWMWISRWWKIGWQWVHLHNSFSVLF